jgi:hypothetical protein
MTTSGEPVGRPDRRRRHRSIAVGALASALVGLLVLAPAAWAKDPPAAGAPIDDLIYLTVGMTVAIAACVLPLIAYRRGKLRLLGRAFALVERGSSLPGWADLPRTMLTGALTLAIFGMYWDVAIHFEKGRDPGPLANGAHYFILGGLLGVFVSGVVGAALAGQRSPTAVRIKAPKWDVPVGAIVIVACGQFALVAFPLDDIWHRFFGQDVTLWGPTHLLIITGASLATIGGWMLYVEAVAVRHRAALRLPARAIGVATAGAFLLGLSTYQIEYDIGLPQFRLVEQPVIIMLAGAVALVAARIGLGRGGALGAVAFFILVRALLTLLIGPIIGHSSYHFPLYLAEGLLVEIAAVALARRGSSAEARPVAFGAGAGALIGTLGFAAEWGWSHVWGKFPWTAGMLPEAAILGLVAAVGGGVIGGYLGRALTPTVARKERAPRFTLPLAALAVLGAFAYALPLSTAGTPPRAAVTLTPAGGGPDRTVDATIRLIPKDAAKDAEWFNVTAWGGGGLVVDHLTRVSAGVYRTTKPIPVYPKWKVAVRLHRGREILAAPIFLPADTAIPAPGVPASASFVRPFDRDKKLVQREQKRGVSPLVIVFSYLTVLLLTASLLGLIVWALRRLETRLAGGVPNEPAFARTRESLDPAHVEEPPLDALAPPVRGGAAP